MIFKAPAKKKTVLTIKYDCGFNNYLTIRGEGAKGFSSDGVERELSWERGIPLKNIKADEWVFESKGPFKTCQFKILINDELYECGENHSLANGEALQITPLF